VILCKLYGIINCKNVEDKMSVTIDVNIWANNAANCFDIPHPNGNQKQFYRTHQALISALKVEYGRVSKNESTNEDNRKNKAITKIASMIQMLNSLKDVSDKKTRDKTIDKYLRDNGISKKLVKPIMELFQSAVYNKPEVTSQSKKNVPVTEEHNNCNGASEETKEQNECMSDPQEMDTKSPIFLRAEEDNDRWFNSQRYRSRLLIDENGMDPWEVDDYRRFDNTNECNETKATKIDRKNDKPINAREKIPETDSFLTDEMKTETVQVSTKETKKSWISSILTWFKNLWSNTKKTELQVVSLAPKAPERSVKTDDHKVTTTLDAFNVSKKGDVIGGKTKSQTLWLSEAKARSELLSSSIKKGDVRKDQKNGDIPLLVFDAITPIPSKTLSDSDALIALIFC